MRCCTSGAAVSAAYSARLPPLEWPPTTTYVCPGHFAYVGFRGTDTTLTGWREDFNMAYRAPVEAQVRA